MPSLRCDECGRFCSHLWPVYAYWPDSGIDHEICTPCKKAQDAKRAEMLACGTDKEAEQDA